MRLLTGAQVTFATLLMTSDLPTTTHHDPKGRTTMNRFLNTLTRVLLAGLVVGATCIVATTLGAAPAPLGDPAAATIAGLMAAVLVTVAVFRKPAKQEVRRG